MNVLVTGAAGFVGAYLIRELESANHSVIAAVNNKEKLAFDCAVVRADLMNKDEILKHIDLSKVDAVVNLAGLAIVGASFENPLQYLSVNVGIEVNIYESCIEHGVRPKMLIISSGLLYDPTSQMPLNETSPLHPSSPYAVSKVAQEVFVQYYEKRGFNSIIARPFNHIGPGQNLGFIVPDFVQQIVAGERGEITKIKVGNLDAKRDYTDVRDIVRAYRLLLEADVENEVFNICSGISVSASTILEMLLSLSKTKLTISQDESRMRPSDISEIYGDNSKLSNKTGWKPKHKLEQTLADVLQDYRNK